MAAASASRRTSEAQNLTRWLIHHEVHASQESSFPNALLPDDYNIEQSVHFPLNPNVFGIILHSAIDYGDGQTLSDLLFDLMNVFRYHTKCENAACVCHCPDRLNNCLRILETIVWRLSYFQCFNPFLIWLRCMTFDAVTSLQIMIFETDTNFNICDRLKPRLRSMTVAVLETGFSCGEQLAQRALMTVEALKFEIHDWEIVLEKLTKPISAYCVEHFRKFHFFATTFHFSDQMLLHSLIAVPNLLELTVDATFTLCCKIWSEGANPNNFSSLGECLDVVWRYLHDSAQCLCDDCSTGLPRLIAGGLLRLISFLCSKIHDLNVGELLKHEYYFEPLASILEHLLNMREPFCWYFLYNLQELDEMLSICREELTHLMMARNFVAGQGQNYPRSLNLFGSSGQVWPINEASQGIITSLLLIYRKWPRTNDDNIIWIKKLANRAVKNVLQLPLDLAFAIKNQTLPHWVAGISNEAADALCAESF